MKRSFCLWFIALLGIAVHGSARAQSALEKIDKSGTLIIGARTGSPPFAYINKNNEWVGFSIDLVEKAILPALNKKLNKQVKLEKKESAPQTRIPLLTSNAVDLIAETMTDTQSRRETSISVSPFSSPARNSWSRKAARSRAFKPSPTGASRRSKAPPTRKLSARAYPPPSCSSFPISPRPFKPSLKARCTPTPTTAFSLPGLKAKAPKPDEWAVVGEFFSYEPYGMAMRKNDSDFRQIVNVGLMDAIASRSIFRDLRKMVRGQRRSPLSSDCRDQALPANASRAEMSRGNWREARLE